MSLDDLPIVGQLFAGVGLLVDLFANGGEIVVALVSYLLAHTGLLFGLVTTLDKLANRMGWLPPGVLDAAVNVVLVAMLVLYLLRLGSKYQESKT